MTDVFSKEQRSEIMRQVKGSRNKSTELKLIQFFKNNKIVGWRRKYKFFGNPDFVFLKFKTAVFVDGCFWHGHNCRNITHKDNNEYWSQKISRNKERDKKVTKELSFKGWNVIRIRECELKKLTSLKSKFLILLK